jgi:hypothetical protein
MYVFTDKRYLMVYIEGQNYSNLNPYENPPAFEELKSNLGDFIEIDGKNIAAVFFELADIKGFNSHIAHQIAEIVNSEGKNEIDWGATFQRFWLGAYKRV